MLITFTVRDQLDAPVAVAKVKIFTDAEVFVTEDTTPVSGAVTFDLPDGDYIARVSVGAMPYVNPSPFSFTVEPAGDDNFNLPVELMELPSADNPVFCRVSGYLYHEDPVTTKIALERVWPQQLLDPNIGQVSFLSGPYTLSVDDGYGLADLLKGARYNVNLLRAARRWWMQIPNTSSAEIGAVLFPQVLSITPSSALVSLAIGEEVEVTYSQLYYSGLNMSSDDLQAGGAPERQFDDLDDDNDKSIEFTSSDDTIAVVDDDCGVLRIRGIAAGTATISVAAANPWADVMKPSVDSEWPDLIEVEVS